MMEACLSEAIDFLVAGYLFGLRFDDLGYLFSIC